MVHWTFKWLRVGIFCLCHCMLPNILFPAQSFHAGFNGNILLSCLMTLLNVSVNKEEFGPLVPQHWRLLTKQCHGPVCFCWCQVWHVAPDLAAGWQFCVAKNMAPLASLYITDYSAVPDAHKGIRVAYLVESWPHSRALSTCPMSRLLLTLTRDLWNKMSCPSAVWKLA